MTPPQCLKTNKELWSPNGIMNVRDFQHYPLAFSDSLHEPAIQREAFCALQVMIWTTWAILIVSFILLLLTYNFFPDFQDERSW